MHVQNLSRLNLKTAGNAWARIQHFRYWCPGTKAPGHQYPRCCCGYRCPGFKTPGHQCLQCWWNIYCFGPISCQNISSIMKNIRNKNNLKFEKKIETNVVSGLRSQYHSMYHITSHRATVIMTNVVLCCHYSAITLQWRHNGLDGVSNHRRLDCLFNRLFKRRSNKTSTLRITAFVRRIPGDRWIPLTKGQ